MTRRLLITLCWAELAGHDLLDCAASLLRKPCNRRAVQRYRKLHDRSLAQTSLAGDVIEQPGDGR